MLHEPTTLILGAGASAPYGYPLGGALVDQIVRESSNPSGTLRTALAALDCRSGDVQEFATRLRDSGLSSIDAFLEGNSAEQVRIGKVAIAYNILSVESKEAFFQHPPKQGQWYEYVWNLIRQGSHTNNLKQNGLSVVTFNYDRSFEYVFITAIKNTFGIPHWQTAEQLFRESIPVIHLHGIVGKPDALGAAGGSLRTDLLRRAAEQIRVVSDAIAADDAAFGQARALLSTSRRWAFLGFGYHPANIARLRLNELRKTGKQHVFGSTYLMGLAEIIRAEMALHLGKTLLNRDTRQDAAECLKQLPMLM